MKTRVPPDATADEGVTNDERASWAELGLLAFGQHTGMICESVGDDEDPFLVISDFLADLAHWCDRNQVDLQAAIRHSTRHYQIETGSRGRQLVPNAKELAGIRTEIREKSGRR